MNRNPISQFYWEVLDKLPSGEQVIQFQRNPVDSSKDFVVRVQSLNGKEWVGNFHGIDKQYFSDVLIWPKEGYLCIVSGGIAYIVLVDDPDEYEELTIVPIVNSFSIIDSGIVIFTTFNDIYAFGEDGLLWSKRRLAIDGIRIKEITNGVIYGISDNIIEEIPFSLDIKTGIPR